MLRNWLRRLRRPARAQLTLDDADWSAATRALRLLDGRGEDELAALRELVAWFLARRAFSGTHGLVVTPHMRLVIALQACLPLLHLPREWLGHWHEVILYPGQFRVRRRAHEDDASDIVTEWDDELAGESWSHGPVILSWADVEQDLADPHEGFNVVIHEIAHKIDMADGDSDGTPPLRGARRREWREAMQAAYEAHAQAVEREEETVLDAYAAEAPDEFFAVASEYYFSAPDVLSEHYTGVFAQLARLYGPVPDPMTVGPPPRT